MKYIIGIISTLFLTVSGFAQLPFAQNNQQNHKPFMAWESFSQMVTKSAEQQKKISALCTFDAQTEEYIKQNSHPGQPFFISRDAKDPRLLHFLGQTYKAYFGGNSVSNYFPATNNAGIVVSFQTGITIQDEVYHMTDFLSGLGYQTLTEDFRNPKDILVSFFKPTKRGIDYKVMRTFKKSGRTYTVTLGRRLCSKNIPLMRTLFQALQQTPQEVFPYDFSNTVCTFGEDCYE